ncbi:probable peptide chain release factor C12orf65 homolog, mitochondrial [Stegodyphus dumicola]|uniref:probable peptide chain release factor C12orf65 homolog, mitochondrial n=1 Tax=Stegodyphus dumicola TaxID=202533 RepID=UPI0015A80579|nr:probable peptide chain release factor C12orf65 homolog, mitochondrial [Stegodyphus dumicola]
MTFLLKLPMNITKSPLSVFLNTFKYRSTIDYSKFPVLNEKEIDEQFIQGHGPGGSNVNKSSNCVLLKHIPTGIVVKCHESRLLQRNQEIAREMLCRKLDEFLNGDMSVSAQKKRIEKQKFLTKQKKNEKLRELKKKFSSSNVEE